MAASVIYISWDKRIHFWQFGTQFQGLKFHPVDEFTGDTEKKDYSKIFRNFDCDFQKCQKFSRAKFGLLSTVLHQSGLNALAPRAIIRPQWVFSVVATKHGRAPSEETKHVGNSLCLNGLQTSESMCVWQFPALGGDGARGDAPPGSPLASG